jgi:hypothetical protein
MRFSPLFIRILLRSVYLQQFGARKSWALAVDWRLLSTADMHIATGRL